MPVVTAAAGVTAADRIFPFQLDQSGVRGRLVRLGPALDAIVVRHGYPPAVARALIEAMTLCVALASALKYDGIFTLQIAGEGPVRVITADVTSQGALRGYASWDKHRLAAALGGDASADAPASYVPRLFGAGTLAFTVDQDQGVERYQGVVPLEGATLADCAHLYFRQSEQLPTGLKLAVERGASGWRAAVLLLQQMPALDAGRREVDLDQREDDWRRAVIMMASAREAELLGPVPTDAALVHRLFHEDRPRGFESRPIEARCRCTTDRIDRVLRTLGREQLQSLRDERGLISVNCEFCSRVYDYDDAAIARLYADPAD